MKKFSTKRAAALGMTSALALGTVAGVTAPADAATSAPTSYTCSILGTPTPLSVVGTLALPATIESGRTLKGLATSMDVTLPFALVANLASTLGVTDLGGSASGVVLPMSGGAAGIPVASLSIPQTAPVPPNDLALHASGVTSGGRAPLPGTYTVSMPSSFDFNPTGTIGGALSSLPTVPCSTTAATALGTLTVVKAASTTTAKLVNAPVTTTKHAKIATTVKAAGFPATGTVVAMQGTKALKSATLKSGKATLVLPLLKRGAHTIKVVYKATKANKASSKSLSFTVKRG